jgi:uncharacterized protein YcbX
MNQTPVGRLAAIHRYPVKSLAGQRIPGVHLDHFGMLFDRQYAILDVESGLLVDAKNEQRWPRLYFHRARCMHPGEHPPVDADVCITLADGSRIMASSPAVHDRLSQVFGRKVVLISATPRHGTSLGSFADVAPIHLISRGSLDMIPGPQFGERVDVARFRPNLVLDLAQPGFFEDTWIDREIAIGSAVLRILDRTRRCARITLPQPSSANQPELLRFIALGNASTLGVYAEVVKPGVIQTGDAVLL